MVVKTEGLPFQKFEMNDEGWFRIGIRKDDGEYEWSEWASYSGVARVVIDGQLFIGVSDYYSGLLPSEQAQLVTPLSTKEE